MKVYLMATVNGSELTFDGSGEVDNAVFQFRMFDSDASAEAFTAAIVSGNPTSSCFAYELAGQACPLFFTLATE